MGSSSKGGINGPDERDRGDDSVVARSDHLDGVGGVGRDVDVGAGRSEGDAVR